MASSIVLCTLLTVLVNFLFMVRLIYSQTAELSDIYGDYEKLGYCLDIIKYFQIDSQLLYGAKLRKHSVFSLK